MSQHFDNVSTFDILLVNNYNNSQQPIYRKSMYFVLYTLSLRHSSAMPARSVTRTHDVTPIFHPGSHCSMSWPGNHGQQFPAAQENKPISHHSCQWGLPQHFCSHGPWLQSEQGAGAAAAGQPLGHSRNVGFNRASGMRKV